MHEVPPLGGFPDWLGDVNAIEGLRGPTLEPSYCARHHEDRSVPHELAELPAVVAIDSGRESG